MEINAETELWLLRQRWATSALWFLWVLKEGRGWLAWSTLRDRITLWMTRGLMLSPVPGLSLPILLGAGRAT